MRMFCKQVRSSAKLVLDTTHVSGRSVASWGATGGAKGGSVGAGAGAGAGLLFAIKFTTSGSQIEFAPGSTLTLDVSDRAAR